ncbi:hypothetical protein [Mycobacterium sp.]|uniref:hypothetical protein n=1 Tax=Mycobacterium sp. TaxID=1785 RepID=UPI003BAEFAF3
MTDRDQQLMAEATFVLADAIHLLNISGQRIPHRWPKTLAALNRRLSVDGQPERANLSVLKTTEQLASEWGCHARTIRRKAEAAGGRKVNGWIFPEDT